MKHFFAAVSVLLAGHQAALAQTTLDRLEASVNSAIILQSDVREFRETVNLRAQLDPLFAGTQLAEQGRDAPREKIVEFLIDEKLIAQQFPIGDAEVEQEINSIQSNNRIDRETLKRALKEQGFDFEDYFEMIRTSAAKRNLIDRDIRTKVTISDDDVKNYYYNRYAKESSSPMAYHVKIITVSPESYKSPEAAKEVAEKARADIEGGEPFEEVARRVSDHPSASSGGDLGVLSSNEMNSEIRGAVSKLKIGETSRVVGGPKQGYFILKLEDVNSTETDQFKKMKEQIRAQLAASEYQRQIQLWLDRQRQEAFIHRAGESSIPGRNKQSS